MSLSDETQFYVAFSHIPGIGPEMLKKLIVHCHSLQKAFEAKPALLHRILPLPTYKNFLSFRRHNNPHSILKKMLKKDIHIITPNMSEWPNKLRTIPQPPLCLYIKGDKNLISESTLSTTPSLAIVGSRRTTHYGHHITSLFASHLAASGVIIISGMAAGIDAYAHEITLDHKGKTVAVLANGVDIVYPRQNRALYERILAHNGAIVSEFPPGQRANPGLFIARNRIVSGLSDGVLVVEGADGSGTLSTIRHAGDQGRPVFAAPYSINSIYSYSPNYAIQSGGTFVVKPQDIFPSLTGFPPSTIHTPLFDLLPQEHIIFSSLKEEIDSPDNLSGKLDIPITDILTLLTQLEIKGYVAKNTLGEYYIT